MTKDPEAQAAKLLDEYLQAFLNGQQPVLGDYLARCPERLRASFTEAVGGVDFLHANYEPLLARPEVAENVHARIAQLAARRQRSDQARRRLEAGGDGGRVRKTLEFLSQLFGLAAPTEPNVDLQPQPVAMYRTARAIAPGSAGWAQAQVRRARAEQEAATLLARLGMHDPPIDPYRVAEALGVLVLEREIDDCDGAVVVDADAAGVLVNSTIQSPGRRRFTLAHELGHLLLHEHRFHYRMESLREIENQATDEMDQEANCFAAALLMPLSVVQPEYTTAPPTLELFDRLSAACGVSMQAAGSRIVTTSDFACLMIAVDEGVVAWAVRSSSWRGPFIPPSQRVPSSSAAASVLQGRTGDEKEASILVSEWSGRSVAWSGPEVYEEARCTGPGRALVLLTHED